MNAVLIVLFKTEKKPLNSPTHTLILILIMETAFKIFPGLLFPKGASCRQFCKVFANGKRSYKFMITMKPLGGCLVGICLFVKILPLR